MTKKKKNITTNTKSKTTKKQKYPAAETAALTTAPVTPITYKNTSNPFWQKAQGQTHNNFLQPQVKIKNAFRRGLFSGYGGRRAA